MTHATLKTYNGNVTLTTDGNPLVVEITYKGSFGGISDLPNGFILTGGRGKILIIRMVDQEFPENLFSYSGSFLAKKVVLYEKKVKLTGKVEVITNRWQTLLAETNTWEAEGGTWQNYGDNRIAGKHNDLPKPPRTQISNIMTNNIKSVSGNLITKDGEPYYGDVHYHSAGYFMTGGTHSEDSVRLYRKNRIRIKRRRNG